MVHGISYDREKDCRECEKSYVTKVWGGYRALLDYILPSITIYITPMDPIKCPVT